MNASTTALEPVVESVQQAPSVGNERVPMTAGYPPLQRVRPGQATHSSALVFAEPRRAPQAPVAADSDYRFVDAVGNEYHYAIDGDGAAILTGCEAAVSEVVVPQMLGGHPVAAVAESAFSSSRRCSAEKSLANGHRMAAAAFTMRHLGAATQRNAILERVVLPSGVRSIGYAAFRGCAHLAEVVLPDTLESIDNLAFSCTGLKSISLPARCTHLAPRALRLGPETVSGAETPYRSKLERIEVDPANPIYSMQGGVLCRTIGGNLFEAVHCPGEAEEIELGPEVVRILPSAFAGTTHIGVLRVCEGVEVVHQDGLLPQGTCSQLVVRLARPVDGCDQVVLDMPEGPLARFVFASATCAVPICGEKLLDAYDKGIQRINDQLLRAQLMLARLAKPIMLDPLARSSFADALEPALDSLIIHFGARNYWKGFDHLVDANLLDADRITRAVSLLTLRGDTLTSAYLLELKRTRFGEVAWDYAI